ncbi:MAG: J domain-containing protein [Pseudomonadota bacterium]
MPEQGADRFGMTLRARMGTTLDRLEREARRMLQLEEELSAFANQYYDVVGAATERLAQLEAQPLDDPLAMPAVHAQRDTRDARRVELKTRYRSLAKEIHPDRAMVVDGAGAQANHMHTLNAAYQQGDLAALLKLEAQLLLGQMAADVTTPQSEMDYALREVERAADTYAGGYRMMLNSPINELMLRALSAKQAGWDWMHAVLRKLERAIEERERA